MMLIMHDNKGIIFETILWPKPIKLVEHLKMTDNDKKSNHDNNENGTIEIHVKTMTLWYCQ